MARVAKGEAAAVASYTPIISGASAANFTELNGAGATKTTDTSVTLLGQPTTRVDVPAALATNFEIGVATAIAPFLTVYPGDPPANRIGILLKTDQPSRLSIATFFVGDAGYTNFGTSISETGNQSTDEQWTLVTNTTWSKTGSPVFSGNRRVKVRVAVTAGAAAKVWIAGLYEIPQQRASFCLVCDDGYDEQYSYLVPACKARNVPVSLSISSSLVGTSGFMTEAQLLELAQDSSGLVSLVNHSTANTNLTAQGLANYIADVDRCAEYLTRIGSAKGAKYHVFVQGLFSDDAINALRARGYKGAREVGASNRSFNRQRLLWNIPERFKLPASCNLEDTQPLATVKGYIETAIQAGGTFVAMGHRFNSTAGTIQWTEADMDDLLDFVSQKQKQGFLDLYTLPDLIDTYAEGGRA